MQDVEDIIRASKDILETTNNHDARLLGLNILMLENVIKQQVITRKQIDLRLEDIENYLYDLKKDLLKKGE